MGKKTEELEKRTEEDWTKEMRAVVQRVSKANVLSEGIESGKIEEGLVVLLGVEENDTEKDVEYIADKTANMRIFKDSEDKMNLSVKDINGSVLAISQFTLLGDCRHGRRPSFSTAGKPEMANELYIKYMDCLTKKYGLHVESGVFRTSMTVNICNEGPVTIMLDSKKTF